MKTLLNLSHIHRSWLPLVESALAQVDPTYLEHLENKKNWLPGHEKIFNAFSLPLDQTQYILFGESPYPRPQSANGYAFWDNAVDQLWSPTGLSKEVNRATSLRNIIKMLLIAEGALSEKNTSQSAITTIKKDAYVKTIAELFSNFLNRGVLLLNASLVINHTHVKKDAIQWRPFIDQLLTLLSQKKPNVKLLLFGHIAKDIDKLPSSTHFKHLYAEHPYNISFIHNPKVLKFFKPLRLLTR